MKITLVSRKCGWHDRQILREARKAGVDINTVKIYSLNESEKIIEEFGDVVLWSTCFLETVDEKTLILKLADKKFVINKAYSTHPFITRKIYQQKYLKAKTNINCIPTHQFEDAKHLNAFLRKSKKVIKKPNVGSQGDRISVLEKSSDIAKEKENIASFIFQPFIENDGDYRVLVLGGRVLGAIKRVAKKGTILNNISKGGHAIQVSDSVILEKISSIALKVASVFDLSFCGVDIIFNKADSGYYFLEVNANPQWRGFQGATGINVAEKIVEYCCLIGKRAHTTTPLLVEQYFENYYEYLGIQKFHYASRLFLWTREKRHKERLMQLKSSFLGKDKKELNKKIAQLLKSTFDPKDLIQGDLRKKYLEKHYPKLVGYNQILFLSLFSETVYREDIKNEILRHINKKELLTVFNNLRKDKKAVAILSSFAVNFFYNLSHFLEKRIISPRYFLEIAKEEFAGDLGDCVDLRLYLLTHAIIGESKFYARHISKKRKEYLEMIKMAEKILVENYFSVSLDNKFEFLTCANIIGYKSSIERSILGEAKRSLSDLGNFLVSKMNDSFGATSQNIWNAEHRNVLYLLANKKMK